MPGMIEKANQFYSKETMLHNALERIIQLYTDKSHFIYELLQNAEDAQATGIRFEQYEDRLEVFHDGKPFTGRNLHGLRSIGESDKTLNQIGEFGVGFKSVFSICDTVYLYSDPSHFRKPAEIEDAEAFAAKILNFVDLTEIDMEPLPKGYTTRFVFPYTVGKSFSGYKTTEELQHAVSERLKNLGITTLLFMQNLELIEYQIVKGNSTVTGQYVLDKKIINDHCTFVSALGSENNKEETISYLKFSRPINVHVIDKDAETLDASTKITKEVPRTVDIAFPVLVDKANHYTFVQPPSPRVSVYFPTITPSNLNFIIQGPFRTTPNRESIPTDDEENQRLAIVAKTLLRDSVLEMVASGIWNTTFLKAMPFNKNAFVDFDLFKSMFDEIYSLFLTQAVIPNAQGEYVSAKNAKIARQEKLIDLLPSPLLSDLINNGTTYSWLPNVYTETNKEYETVYKFLTSELHVSVIRPEDLRNFIVNNPFFLPQRTNEWLTLFYAVIEKISNLFVHDKSVANMLTADIIKTTLGKFVSPCRKGENNQLLPNIFLPSEKIDDNEINVVDSELYASCRHFFDDIIRIQKPNEYEFILKDLRERYSEPYVFDETRYFFDVKNLMRCYRNEQYNAEAERIIKEQFVWLCTDGKTYNSYDTWIMFPLYEGIDLENYYKNINSSYKFLAMEKYADNGVPQQFLISSKIQTSIFRDESTILGNYDGKHNWYTSSTQPFRWKFTIDSLLDVLCYIEKNPQTKDALIKSKIIYTILLQNTDKLYGTLNLSGNSQPIQDSVCEMLQILLGSKKSSWCGKWLFDVNMELVAPHMIEPAELNHSIYGEIVLNSKVYNLLNFKKSRYDVAREVESAVSKEKLNAYVENVILEKFGYSMDELRSKLGDSKPAPITTDTVTFDFPDIPVRSWESLKKHAAEMLIYANPVKYEIAVRRIRTSNKPAEKRAYLQSMYRIPEIRSKYACQICHEATGDIVADELFLSPDTELDPMNLCLCPNCSAKYKQVRNDPVVMKEFANDIMQTNDVVINNSEQLSFQVEDMSIWFSKTHFAEIRELMRLAEQAKQGDAPSPVPVITEQGEQKQDDGLSAYDEYIGKLLRNKFTGFEGEVVRREGEYIVVHVLKGNSPEKAKPNNEVKYKLAVLLTNQTFEFVDKD